jgi:hypothetical protein
MPRINEATDTDLKVIDLLQKSGWKRGDTLLYQQEYKLLPEHRFPCVFNELQTTFRIKKTD